MAILIRQPRYLGHQTFRINRGVPEYARSSDGRTRLIFTPRPGWFEAGDCRKANCEHYQFGWITTVNPTTELGRRQVHYLRQQSGRAFREESGGDGLIRFVFEPGQKCFQEHKLPVDRDPIFINAARGRQAKRMDYDEFFDTMNETVTQIMQHRKEI